MGFMGGIRDAMKQDHMLPFLSDRRGMKWYAVLRVKFSKHKDDGEEVTTEAFFHSTTRMVSAGSNLLDSQLLEMEQEILGNMEEFQREGSGWTVDDILGLDLFMASYKPLQGSSYLPTPKFLENKRAVVNVHNQDQKCFLWSVLAALYPRQRNAYRVHQYMPYQNTLNMGDVPFPVEVRHIPRIERLNNLSINVFGFENEEEGVFPVYVTETPKATHVNLLLISDEQGHSHYILIRSLSRLLRKSASTHKQHYCPYCLHGFYRECSLEEHLPDCRPHGPQKTVFPKEEEKVLKFTNHKAMMACPFVIYADLESYIQPLPSCRPDPAKSFTQNTALHTPSGYCYTVVSTDPNRSKPAVVYRGPRVMEHFLEALLKEVEEIQEQLQHPTPMHMRVEDRAAFAAAKDCFVCEQPLGADRVRDHDHLTGVYRGAAHAKCNLDLQVRRGKDGKALQVPVVFHNLKGYDANHIMSAMAKHEGQHKISCIAQNMEKYLTFSLGNLKFIDSLQFMSASLDKLVSNLDKAQGAESPFHHLNHHFPQHGELLRRKGVYPYSYVTGPEKLQETHLPPRAAFYNDLQDEALSEEDYCHAQRVWDTFQLRTLGEYHDLYLKTDVLLLADVFENFRKVCLATYKLDPAHYISAPGLSWDSMLRTTKVELDLITDPDMHLFLEKGMRGGISMISHRYAEARNPHMAEYTSQPSSPPSYIAYWDANNLYGWSMSKPLPHSNFQWMPEEQVQAFNPMAHGEQDEEGFVLEVDLEYPDELHEAHNCYPFAPEKLKIAQDMLSPYSRQLGQRIYGGMQHIPSSTKLVPHLGPRKHYVTHLQNLKQCLEHGLVLTRVHRILTFRQKAWLKPYITLNTDKRKAAQNEFEKDFFKLMNNSVFGKSCENVRNRFNVELVTQDERFETLTARPSFRRFKIFHNNLVAVEYLKPKVKMNKPLYTGFSTLELSKTLMYSFHYDVIKAFYGDQARLLFTDTDSLCYHITTPDLYQDMGRMGDWFDTSNYPRDHPLYSAENAKVLGKFKDELAGVPGAEFVGLRPKMYSLLDAQGQEKKTAKGVARTIIRKQLKHQQYKEVLQEGGRTIAESLRIQPQGHRLFTQRVRKTALSAYEDKRYIEADGRTTYAHGHWYPRTLLELLPGNLP